MIIRDQLIEAVLEREGGYVDDPSDSGGETNFGVTIAVARRYGYDGPMIDMPIEKARSIYAMQYWHPIKGQALAEVDRDLVAEVFDTAVNCGVSRSGKFLQRCLNVLNSGQKIALDVVIGGKIGPATIRALSSCAEKRDVAELVKALNCLQGAFYIELAEKRSKDERFIYGWLKHRVGI